MNNEDVYYAIIIPAYEPDEKFITVCDEIKKKVSYPLIVVNDGSQDLYENIFNGIVAKGVIVLKHAVNLGKGRSLKDAFNYVLCNYPTVRGVVTADSDGQHKVDDILKCIKELEKHPNALVLGCRDFDGLDIPWKSKIGNKITTNVFRYLGGIRLTDTQTGLRGMPKSLLVRSLSIKGERFDYETNVLLIANEKFDFIEVPIETVYDSKTEHKTHFDPLRDSFRIYKLIFSYTLSSLLSVIIDFSIFTFAMSNGMNIWIGTAFGRVGSTVLNFAINKNVVFKSSGNVMSQMLRYMFLVVISGTVSALLVSFLSKMFEGRTVILKAIVEGALFFFNYYIQRSYVFAKRKERTDGAKQ